MFGVQCAPYESGWIEEGSPRFHLSVAKLLNMVPVGKDGNSCQYAPIYHRPKAKGEATLFSASSAESFGHFGHMQRGMGVACKECIRDGRLGFTEFI